MHTGRMAPAEHDQAGRRAGGAHRPRIASARRRVLDLPVHDPQALVRVGPDNLVAGDPAGMLSRSVDLERLRLDGRYSQSTQPQCSQGWPGSWSASSSGGPPRRGLAAGAHEHREQALDLLERPGRDPAEGTMRPHSAPLC